MGVFVDGGVNEPAQPHLPASALIWFHNLVELAFSFPTVCGSLGGCRQGNKGSISRSWSARSTARLRTRRPPWKRERPPWQPTRPPPLQRMSCAAERAHPATRHSPLTRPGLPSLLWMLLEVYVTILYHTTRCYAILYNANVIQYYTI